MSAQVDTFVSDEGLNDSLSFKEWMEKHEFEMDDETYTILSKAGFRTMYDVYIYIIKINK